jgi:hypothetical protein
MEQFPDDGYERRWSGYVEPPPESDWPTWGKVRAELDPIISDEECEWELQARIAERRQNEDNK